MTLDTKHTPLPQLELPWRVAYDTRIEYGPYVAGFGFCIAEVKTDPVDWEAKRDFLVRAVNSHSLLVDALKAAVNRMEAVASGIPVENRSPKVSQRAHVAHMAGHLAQHAKIARAALKAAGVEL